MKTSLIDVLYENETKKKGIETSTNDTFSAYWSGVPESERGCQGVGIILSERMNEGMVEYECVNPSLIWVRFKVGLTRLFILSVYVPDNKKTRHNG